MRDMPDRNRLLWSDARDKLVSAVVSLGFPAELGQAAARYLGSPKAIGRMTAYLQYTMPTDANMIVDEMLAIRSEIEAWKMKKAGIEANNRINELLCFGLEAVTEEPGSEPNETIEG